MLFNSFVFLAAFLPVVLLGAATLGGLGWRRAAVAWLVGASLIYYGWWNPAYLGLIAGSILGNYAVGRWLQDPERPARTALLYASVAANLALLAYYKYAGFLLDNLRAAGIVAGGPSFVDVALPLAISFFTFQQITYLVDGYRGLVRHTGLLDYALFVSFFPQLVAGPIVHHAEMMPQFERGSLRLRSADLAAGITFFAIGLFKKVVIADGIAAWSTPVFDAALRGATPGLADAWGGALGYSLQLYFDFSGYSDMAIGLGRMFGIHLPWNFHSPYRADSAIEFWRRWHMTLSRFLRDYVYIALGGNRRGAARRHAHLFVTMLLGGLWHGAGWTFVLWGGIHGLYLVANHGFRAARARFAPGFEGTIATRAAARATTFVAVVFAWVLFRAESLDASWRIWRGMVGLGTPTGVPIVPAVAFGALAAGLGIAWLAPNTQQWMSREPTGIDEYGHGTAVDGLGRWVPRWQPNAGWALFVAGLAMIAFHRMMSDGYQEFLYRFF